MWCLLDRFLWGFTTNSANEYKYENFRSCLQTKLDTNKAKYKWFKDKMPGIWPKLWKHFCCSFLLGIFGEDDVCLFYFFVCFLLWMLEVSYYNKFLRDFSVGEIFAIRLVCNWCYSGPKTTNNILPSLFVDFSLFGNTTLVCNH